MTRDAQTKNTQSFLREFQILEQLAELDLDFSTEENLSENESKNQEILQKMAEERLNPFNFLLKNGQIRLLSQTENLTYGVVLPWDWNHSLLVPFSHCCNPATNFEVYADGTDRGLFQQVFQIWNARTVNKTILGRSWVMGNISQTETDRINEMLHYHVLGDQPSEKVCALTGLPIEKADDIRLRFLKTERENFLAMDAEDLQADEIIGELEEDNTILAFNDWAQKLDLQAAAGSSDLSEAYVMTPRGLEYVRQLQITDFERVAPGQKLSSFCWIADDLPAEFQTGMQVIFRHKFSSGRILGSGILLRDQPAGHEILLMNPVDEEEIPEIRKPADIQVIFCRW